MAVDLPASLRALYPFTSRFFTTPEGSRLHYVDTGPPSDEVVVCVHGNPTWSFYFRRVLERLGGSRRVLALDHLGCGLSDKPLNHDYHLGSHVANFAAWLEHCGARRVHLLAHDWGGAIACSWAVEHPQAVASVSLSNTAAFYLPHLPWRIAACRLPGVGWLLVRNLNLFARAATYMATHSGLHPRVRAGLLFPYQRPVDRIGIQRFVEDIPWGRWGRTYQRLQRTESGLSQLRVPVQLLWGVHDFCFTLEFLRKWQSLIPHAEVHLLRSAAHYVLEDAPEEAIDLYLKFLEAR